MPQHASSGRAGGRPRAVERRDISQQIRDAAQTCLRERAHSEVTIRDIARSAGVSQEMIGYYFGNKDGLLLELIKDLSKDTVCALTALEEKLDGNLERPTDCLVQTLSSVFFRNKYVSNILISEFLKSNSSMRTSYFGNRTQSKTTLAVESIVARLQAQGIYRNDMDCALIARSICALVLAPLTLPVQSPGAEPEWDETWLEHVTATLDAAYLRH
ncbi:MAG: TetR/AcrR family transcriptional regulator [Caulobacterales bacterium]